MARGDSVTISFRLNLNREEDIRVDYQIEDAQNNTGQKTPSRSAEVSCKCGKEHTEQCD